VGNIPRRKPLSYLFTIVATAMQRKAIRGWGEKAAGGWERKFWTPKRGLKKKRKVRWPRNSDRDPAGGAER